MQEIARKYQEITGQDLTNEFKTKFDCNFQKILVALMMPQIDFYVQELNESLENYDHDSTIDILCPLSNYEMYTLKYVYQKSKKLLNIYLEILLNLYHLVFAFHRIWNSLRN